MLNNKYTSCESHEQGRIERYPWPCALQELPMLRLPVIIVSHERCICKCHHTWVTWTWVGTQVLPLTPCVARATPATPARDNHVRQTQHTQATSTQTHRHTDTHRQPHTFPLTHTHTQTHSLSERREAHPAIELQRCALWTGLQKPVHKASGRTATGMAKLPLRSGCQARAACTIFSSVLLYS
jgi:hypothetical protein